jgi:hypothetical protein
MDYKIPPPEASEARESTAPYYTGRRPAAEPRLNPDGADGSDDNLDEFGEKIKLAPDGEIWLDWMMENEPEFRDFVLRRADEAEARIAAGGGLTGDEVLAELEWRIKNNQWDDVEERMRQNGYL